MPFFYQVVFYKLAVTGLARAVNNLDFILIKLEQFNGIIDLYLNGFSLERYQVKMAAYSTWLGLVAVGADLGDRRFDCRCGISRKRRSRSCCTGNHCKDNGFVDHECLLPV